MSVTGKTLNDTAQAYPTLQAGDLMFVERAGVAGKSTFAQVRDALATTFAQSILDDATATQALTTLGVTTQAAPIRIRIGNLQVLAGTLTTNASGNLTFTFPTAFAAAPILLLTPFSDIPVDATFQTLTASSVFVQTWNSTSGAALGPIGVHWLAIGTF